MLMGQVFALNLFQKLCWYMCMYSHTFLIVCEIHYQSENFSNVLQEQTERMNLSSVMHNTLFQNKSFILFDNHTNVINKIALSIDTLTRPMHRLSELIDQSYTHLNLITNYMVNNHSIYSQKENDRIVASHSFLFLYKTPNQLIKDVILFKQQVTTHHPPSFKPTFKELIEFMLHPIVETVCIFSVELHLQRVIQEQLELLPFLYLEDFLQSKMKHHPTYLSIMKMLQRRIVIYHFKIYLLQHVVSLQQLFFFFTKLMMLLQPSLQTDISNYTDTMSPILLIQHIRSLIQFHHWIDKHSHNMMIQTHEHFTTLYQLNVLSTCHLIHAPILHIETIIFLKEINNTYISNFIHWNQLIELINHDMYLHINDNFQSNPNMTIFNYSILQQPLTYKTSTHRQLQVTETQPSVFQFVLNQTINDQIISGEDPFFQKQWGLLKDTTYIGATNAILGWKIWDGLDTSPFVIAILDSGIDISHADLQNRLWVNDQEVCNNGVDDDNNGYIDDCYGWDFVSNDNFPNDEAGHGTAVAGIIASVPYNRRGVTPACWNCRLMNLRVLDEFIGGTLSSFIQALDYALQKHVRVSNHSYGCKGINIEIFQKAIERARKEGMIIVTASGNSGTNNDYVPIYPATFHSDNILTVMGVGPDGDILPFSNFGKRSVHIAAPGLNILVPSLRRNTIILTKNNQLRYSSNHLLLPHGYHFVSGTSYATPFVSSLVALVWSREPYLTYKEVINKILQGTRPLSTLKDKTMSGGVIDYYKTLRFSKHHLSAHTNISGMTYTTTTCSVGYRFHPLLQRCRDINECNEYPPVCPKLLGVKCINYPGTFECRCPKGNVWTSTDNALTFSCYPLIIATKGLCKYNGGCHVNSICRISSYNPQIKQCHCFKGYMKHSKEQFCIRKGLEYMNPVAYLSGLLQAIEF